MTDAPRPHSANPRPGSHPDAPSPPLDARLPFAVSLGSNLGDSPAILADAVRRLADADGVVVTAVSSLYRTAPVGGVDQPDFCNAVVLGRTTLTGEALLAVCQRIEAAHCRTREVRWGPRTLDVDILALGDLVSDDPSLTLPHPRAQERAFVLVPWLEVDAAAAIPGRGRVATLLDAVGRDGVRLAGTLGFTADASADTADAPRDTAADHRVVCRG